MESNASSCKRHGEDASFFKRHGIRDPGYGDISQYRVYLQRAVIELEIIGDGSEAGQLETLMCSFIRISHLYTSMRSKTSFSKNKHPPGRLLK